MKIHEYQAKEILKKYGVTVPHGIPCFTVDEAVAAAQKIGGTVWVVKAQIHAGGRGKGGGVKIAKSLEEVRTHAHAILGMTLVTPQTGPEGKVVKRLFIEEGAHIAHEYYVGLVIDRETQKPCLIASSAGGMDIEEVAQHHPEKIHKVFIDYTIGLTETDARDIANKLGIPADSTHQMITMLQNLCRAFWDLDASLLEINPLARLASGDIVALDAKINFDGNALFRHQDILSLRDLDEEDPHEIEASAHQLSYISLSGNIGCLVNGAGLAMATMDMVKLFGGSPANFLDVGGGASVDKIVASFQIMLKNPEVKVLFVNVFGGILHCTTVAQGLIDAAKILKLDRPIVARLVGTKEQEAKALLSASDVNIIVKNTMAEAARTSVDLAHSLGA